MLFTVSPLFLPLSLVLQVIPAEASEFTSDKKYQAVRAQPNYVPVCGPMATTIWKKFALIHQRNKEIHKANWANNIPSQLYTCTRHKHQRHRKSLYFFNKPQKHSNPECQLTWSWKINVFGFKKEFFLQTRNCHGSQSGPQAYTNLFMSKLERANFVQLNAFLCTKRMRKVL